MIVIYYNKLDKYKKYIIHEKRWNVFFVILGIFLFALILWGAFYSTKALVLSIFPILILFFSIKGIAGNNRLLNELTSIEKDQTISQTTEINLSFPKVIFLGKAEHHGLGYYHPKFYGIKLIDSHKNKYYYFFDDYFEYDKYAIDKMREKFSRNISIQCYKGTSIIRTVENDPNFLRFKFGKFCA